jgi:hypothetical protein
MIRLLAAVVALIGLRYAAIGATVLWNLHAIVTDWVAATGDPDFRLDYRCGISGPRRSACC